MVVDHKLHHKYPKLLKIPLLNTEHNTIYIPRKTAIGKITTNKNRNDLRTKDDSDKTVSPVHLPSILIELSFQLEQNNTKLSIVLHDAQILQEARAM